VETVHLPAGWTAGPTGVASPPLNSTMRVGVGSVAADPPDTRLPQTRQLRLVEIFAVREDFNLIVGGDLRIDQRLYLFQECFRLDRPVCGSNQGITRTM